MEASSRRLGDHPLQRFFTTLTEKNFYEQLGWPDQPVIRYVANLLTEFSDVDRLYRVRQAGERRTLVSELLLDAEATSFGVPRKDVHRHIGDFTLFMTGLFPEHLGRLKTGGLVVRSDFLLDYVKVGKRSYRIVSELDGDSPNGDEFRIFRKLSEHFELCVAGLGYIRRDLHRRRNEALDRWRGRWLS